MRRGCKGEVVLNTSGRGDTGALNKQYNQEESEEVLEVEVAYPLKEHLVADGYAGTATQSRLRKDATPKPVEYI
jgi:hypothetical protein